MKEQSRCLLIVGLSFLVLCTLGFANPVSMLGQEASSVELPSHGEDEDVTMFSPARDFAAGERENVRLNDDGALVLERGATDGTFTSQSLPVAQFNALMFSFIGDVQDGSGVQFLIQCIVDGQASDWQVMFLEDDILLNGSADGFRYRIRLSRARSRFPSPAIQNVGIATADYQNGYEKPSVWTQPQQGDYPGSASRPRVVSRSEWDANSPNGSFSTNFNPRKVVIHHTAGTKGGATIVKRIQRDHQNNRGWTDIGYHFLVSPDGTVFEGRPENVKAAHVAGANSYCLGISAIGHYSNYRCDDPCWNSIVRLTAYACKRYGISPENIIGHTDMANKDCPGRRIYSRMDELRRAVASRLGRSTNVD